jgi:hypothetical protein
VVVAGGVVVVAGGVVVVAGGVVVVAGGVVVVADVVVVALFSNCSVYISNIFIKCICLISSSLSIIFFTSIISFL